MSLTIAILTFVFVLILGALAYWHEFKKNKKKFTGFQIVIIVTMAGALAFGVLNEVRKSSDSTKSENNVNGNTSKIGDTLNKKIGDKINESSNRGADSFKAVHSDVLKGLKLHVPNTRSKKPYAILDFSYGTDVGKENPTFLLTNKNDSVILKVGLTNWGTGFAFNIDGAIYLIGKRSSKLFLVSEPKNSQINKTIIIPPDKHMGYSFDKVLSLTDNYKPNNVSIAKDSEFVCFKFDFSDSTNKRKSLQGIYYIDQSLKMRQPRKDHYNEIEYFLKSNRYWKPPFKQ